MEACSYCYFKGKQTNGNTYCKLWKEMATWTECSSFTPEFVLCDVCHQRPAEYIAYLNDRKEGFLCIKCEEEVRYDPIYVPFKLSESPNTKIHEVYCIRRSKKGDKNMRDEINESVESLSEKEKKAYDCLLTFRNGVLIRSLDAQQRGCLGTLVKKKLGTISNVILNYRSLKVFKLVEGAT